MPRGRSYRKRRGYRPSRKRSRSRGNVKVRRTYLIGDRM